MIDHTWHPDHHYQTPPLDHAYLRSVVKMALAEDIGNGDITTSLTIPEDIDPLAAKKPFKGQFVAKENGVLAGREILRMVFDSDLIEFLQRVDINTTVSFMWDDGTGIEAGDLIAEVSGQPSTILRGERVALNFLQRLSGIATLTHKYVQLVSHTKAKITDTRKTTPGLRRLEKYAVTVGGGVNHRFNLSDGILIKDNHIAVAGGVTAAVTAAKANAPHLLRIECEVTNLDQLAEAIAAGADIVLLDNMPINMLKQAVEFVAGRVITEASGGVNEQNVAAIAETGVDLISVGALTHSAPALDISLEFR